MNLIEENKRRDLWFKERAGEGWNCYFFPQGWAGEFQATDTSDSDELYGYAPTHTFADSPVDMLSVKVEYLLKMEETTREEALRLHPKLAAYLDEINKAA